ncbi:uncharacterized protein [Argopecten irradians]|uniref:uncharacterized protein n=1 Tax=Argopecten irradians TaxID=31199 RepID=UPI00371942F1
MDEQDIVSDWEEESGFVTGSRTPATIIKTTSTPLYSGVPFQNIGKGSAESEVSFPKIDRQSGAISKTSIRFETSDKSEEEDTDDELLRVLKERRERQAFTTPKLQTKGREQSILKNRVNRLKNQTKDTYDGDTDGESETYTCPRDNSRLESNTCKSKRDSGVKGRVSRREKHPDTFDGKTTDWQDYLVHFEQVAAWNGWSDTEKAQQSASDFGYDLRRVALLAYPELPYHYLECQVVDQFINGLHNFEMRKKVTFSHPSTLDEAISSAVEYEAVAGNSPKKPVESESVCTVQTNSAVEQVLTIDQISNLLDKKLSSKKGKDKKEKKEKKKVNPGQRKGACYFCQEEGHYMRECESLKTLRKRDSELRKAEN